jgi:GAF domain-containing protein
MAVSLERDRQELKRLADEQAALRRVATLVARGLPPAEVFSAVTREVGLLSGVDLARMERYETDGTVTGVAGWSGHDAQLAVGTRFALRGSASPHSFGRRMVPCAWTASTKPPVQSRKKLERWESVRRSAVRSSSQGGSGA